MPNILSKLIKFFTKLEYWTTGQPKSLLKYDYAIIALKKAFAFTKYVNPICLSIPSFFENGPGSHLYVAGWGSPDSNGKSTLTEMFAESNFNTYIFFVYFSIFFLLAA